MSFREVPDWDPEPEVDADVCLPCRRGQFGCTCPRPEEDEEPPPLPGSLDARDATPEPPAYLDPLWVLLMRERLKRYQETGEVWFRPSGGPSERREENANA